MESVFIRFCGTMMLALLVMLAALAASGPAQAHHMNLRSAGDTVGVAIPSISHGEMPIVAQYRSAIMDLAAGQPRTDPTLRRLQGFVSLQYFACLRGMVPGSLADESSPFNECAHAYLAGARALLNHMAEMPGDQAAAKALQTRVDADLTSGTYIICSNSKETFDSGVVIGPDWTLAPTHIPTLLTFSGFSLSIGVGLWASVVNHRRRMNRGFPEAGLQGDSGR